MAFSSPKNFPLFFSKTAQTPKPKNAKTLGLYQELEKYKLLKTQGVLQSLPTETSPQSSNAIFYSSAIQFYKPKEQEDDQRNKASSFLSSNPTNSSTSRSIIGYQPNQMVPQSHRMSSSTGFSTTPLLREAVTHYLTKTQASPRSPIVDTALVKKEEGGLKHNFTRSKKASISSSHSDVEYLSQPQKAESARLSKKPQYFFPKERGSQDSARSSARKESISAIVKAKEASKSPAKTYRDPKKAYSLVQEDSTTLANGKKNGRLSKTVQPDLENEVEEWKKFGMEAAESYEELNAKFKEFMHDKEENKEIIKTLTEEISLLKTELSTVEDENSQMRLNSSNPNQGDSEVSETASQIAMIQGSIEELKKQAANIRKTLLFLQNENNNLKLMAKNVKDYEKQAEHFKKLSERKLKESCDLAEEIITLRTNLDRTRSKNMKSKTVVPQPISQGPSPTRKRGSSFKKEGKDLASPKKVVKWREQLEESCPRKTY